VAALLLSTVFAVPASAETLAEALAMAYGSNPQLQAERARLRATDELVPQALSNWRPTVQVTGSGGISRTDSSSSSSRVDAASSAAALSAGTGSGTQTIRTSDVQLQMAQPLYRGGRTVAQTSQAENLVRAERATLIATEQTVLLNAATAYFDVLRDQSLLDIQIENERVLRGLLQATQAQYRVGTVLETDLQLAQSRLSTAVAQRQTAEGNLETSRETYAQVVGQAPQTLVMPAERPVLPAALDHAKRLAASDNPNVVAAQFNRSAAEDQVKVVRGQLFPTLSVNGTASRSATSQGDRSTDDLSVTAQVSMPLYEAGSVWSQTRQAKQTVSQRASDIDTARRQSVQQAGAAWDAYVSARATILSNRDAVTAQAAALRGVEAQYRAGTRSIIDVLNETQNLLTTRVNLVTAQHNEAVAVYQVTTAIGRMTAVDLRLPVALYDADRNYGYVRDKWFGEDLPDSR
jgi:TolC family type I secretion outer membrane protein